MGLHAWSRTLRDAGTVDDGLRVETFRQSTKGMTSVAIKPGRTERIGDGGYGVAQQP